MLPVALPTLALTLTHISRADASCSTAHTGPVSLLLRATLTNPVLVGFCQRDGNLLKLLLQGWKVEVCRLLTHTGKIYKQKSLSKNSLLINDARMQVLYCCFLLFSKKRLNSSLYKQEAKVTLNFRGFPVEWQP